MAGLADDLMMRVASGTSPMSTNSPIAPCHADAKPFLKEVFHLPIPSSSKEYRAKHGKAAPGCQKHRDAFFLGSNNHGWEEDVQNMTGTINPEGLMDLRPWLRHMNLLSEARDDLKAKEPNEI